MSKLEIRAARPEDMQSIEAVFRSHSPEYDWKFARRYFQSFFTRPEVHEHDVVLIGIAGGRVVGLIGYLHDRREAKGIFWLGWFYVHRDEAGHGFGKKLLDHVIAEVKKLGARKLYTDTSSFKFYDAAHHRYRELGFVKEATLKNFYEKGEDQVIYGMDL